MSKLVHIGLSITFFYGMALDSPGQEGNTAAVYCAVGLIVAGVGLAVSSYKQRKRTHRSDSFYKFK